MGGEASWAGAGMLAPSGEFDRKTLWTDLALESLDAYPDFVAELESESGASIDYRACGSLESADSPAGWERLLERSERQRQFGIACFPDGLALRYPNDALVNPRDVIQALRLACLRRGVEIVEHAAPAPLEADSSPLVIAAGAWSGALDVRWRGSPLPLPPTVPAKGYLLGYHLPPDSLGVILRRGHTYILQRSTGFTIAGSTEERIGFDRTIDPETCRLLHARAATLFPALAGRAPEECWIGFRPATASGEIALGRLADSPVWLAYGHYRNGILMAPATARRLAAEIAA